jgi:hypothetical protein
MASQRKPLGRQKGQLLQDYRKEPLIAPIITLPEARREAQKRVRELLHLMSQELIGAEKRRRSK